MKILLVGDAVVSTGFASCTHAAADALHVAGHEVTILGINHGGDPAPQYPYPIYPCRSLLEGARDAFGVARLPALVERIQPDLVMILQDPWNIDVYLAQLRHKLPVGVNVPVVGWLAADGMNQKAAPELNALAHVIVWTQFAADELRAGGYTGTMSVIPLGVDHSTFYPRNQSVARRRIFGEIEGLEPGKAFIVGAIGRNQLRKRLDLTIEYFADWVHSCNHRDAWLYLHCAPTGEDGADIRSLAKFWKVADRILIARSIVPGAGASVDHMAHVYSALDVYASTSQGEGWGLPALEAMACGVPCLIPDFAAFGPKGWVGDAAIRVPSHSHLLTAPMGAAMYTIGAVPNRSDFVYELESLYCSSMHRAVHSHRGLRRAKEFSWETTGQMMRVELENLLERLQNEAAAATTLAAAETEQPGFADALQETVQAVATDKVNSALES